MNNLVALLRTGSELAFAQIYDSYWEQCLDFALRILQEKDEAQDAVQEVFLDIWRNRENLDIDNLSAYILKATKNKVLMRLRKQKLTQTHLNSIRQITSENTTEEMVMAQELNLHINASVDKLPEKCRHVFKLSRFENLSNREVAQKLNLSENTVENHISHALKRLALLLPR